MSNYKKSAKDLAFDRERDSYKKQIHILEKLFKDKIAENEVLRYQISQKEDEIVQLRDWVERLLEYTELSEEDMKKLIRKEKINLEISEQLKPLLSVFNSFYFRDRL